MKIKGKAPSSARRPSIVDAKNLEYSPGIAPVVLLAAAPALYYGAKSRQPLAVRAKPASKKKMKKQKEKEAAAAAAAAAAPARRKNPKDPKDDDGTAGVMSAVGGLFTVLGGAAALEYYRGEQRAARERARRAAEAEAISDDQCTSPFPIKPKKGGPAAPKATGATAAPPALPVESLPLARRVALSRSTGRPFRSVVGIPATGLATTTTGLGLATRLKSPYGSPNFLDSQNGGR